MASLIRTKKTVTESIPIIRRTRSWRGVMQVRYNDEGSDRRSMMKQAAFWAPLRVFGISFCVFCSSYVMLGHDAFMQSVLGYESEMMFEAKVNPRDSDTINFGSMIEKDKGWRLPIRNLEKPLHPLREFDVMKDGALPPRAS